MRNRAKGETHSAVSVPHPFSASPSVVGYQTIANVPNLVQPGTAQIAGKRDPILHGGSDNRRPTS